MLLVIGGAGYVGSHFVQVALKSGVEVRVMDNLSTGHLEPLSGVDFFRGDLKDFEAFLDHLSHNHYDAIFHFAASCLVGESVADPAKYYHNNLIAAYNMLEAMRATEHDRVVFSSTAAVYGVPLELPIRENHPKNPISPYGRTKLAIEWMLEDYYHAYGIRSASLRYFNAAGCDPDDGLGEDHSPETHLIPNVVRWALNLQDDLVIFGKDYPTSDGTCIRDYIHVTDLAEAHLKACAKLEQMRLIRLNLGTGRGFSNMEVVEAVRRATGTNRVPTMGPRRSGDPPELVADASEATRLLGWKPIRSDLDAMVRGVVKWFSEHPKGYVQ
ncbi:MAG: UDP-glucose 4-epimerase GalE [Deltaproteobacteria bacterium]|nr:UDP-glucose 4-epimerase GalE [Deltaproteobacteria bacterium]